VRTVNLSSTVHPRSWHLNPSAPAVIYPSGAGTLTARVNLTAPGRYEVWIGGSFRARVEISVDGKAAGSARDELNYANDQYEQLGEADLTAGPHTVTLHYGGPDLHPGSAGRGYAPFGIPLLTSFSTGPLVLTQGTPERPVVTVSTSQARSL
jgi:hypothetical protein